MRPGSRVARLRRAFTLIEVMVAAAIFFLLVGGIVAVVVAAVTVPAELALAELRSARNEAFSRFVRDLFRNLPADATVEQRIRQWQGRGEIPELLVAFAGPAVAALPGAAGSGIAISGIPDGAGRFRLSLTTYDASADDAERDRELAAASWVTLIPDVEMIRWQFLDLDAQPVTRTWEQERPPLAEVAWLVSGAREERVVVDIPNVDGTGGPSGRGPDNQGPDDNE